MPFAESSSLYVASTLAAQRDFNPKPHNRVVAAGRRAALAGDVSRLIELDLEFHTGLYNAVGNRVLSDVMRDQWTHLRRVMVVAVAVRREPQLIWSEHATIVEAIMARDPAAAGHAAVAHTRAACQTLLENLSGATDAVRRIERGSRLHGARRSLAAAYRPA